MRFRADNNLVPWLSGLEQRAHNPSDFGSNPNGTTKYAHVAQLAEQAAFNRWVGSSNLFMRTTGWVPGVDGLLSYITLQVTT